MTSHPSVCLHPLKSSLHFKITERRVSGKVWNNCKPPREIPWSMLSQQNGRTLTFPMVPGIQLFLGPQHEDTEVSAGRRQWHPTPVLLPGKSHGQRSLVGCSPWGHQDSDTTERLHFHFSLSCTGEGNGNPLQCSCLENPRDREPGGLLSLGSHRIGHDWSDLAAAFSINSFGSYLCFEATLTRMQEPWSSLHSAARMLFVIVIIITSTAITDLIGLLLSC